MIDPEEPLERHRRKRGNRTFPLEVRYTGKAYVGFQNSEWRVWSKYEKERDRSNALEKLSKKFKSWEFRIPPDQNHEAGA